MAAPLHRAGPPRIPDYSPEQLRAKAGAGQRLKQAKTRERRSMVRGLVILVLLVLLLSIARAGLDRVLPHGWWMP